MNTAIFIDGAYLDKVLYYNFHNREIDYGKLVSEMAAPHELVWAYYYHCLPHLSDSPSEDEEVRYASMEYLITALRLLPRFEVRLGRTVMCGYSADRSPIFIPKGVECRIAVDMVMLAAKHRIHNAAFVSGDSALIPAVVAAKNEEVRVTLWHGAYSENTSPSPELVEVCDERREITEDLIGRIAKSEE